MLDNNRPPAHNDGMANECSSYDLYERWKVLNHKTSALRSAFYAPDMRAGPLGADLMVSDLRDIETAAENERAALDAFRRSLMNPARHERDLAL